MARASTERHASVVTVTPLLDRRLPLRTRLDLVAADVRRRWARRELYGVRFGSARVYISDSSFRLDRASLEFAVTEATYATDYGGSVLLDLGSHKGYVAAYATTRGARSVIAYEPESANVAVLERTAVGYRGDGVTWEIRRAAVDAESGQAELHVMKGSWAHALRPPASFAKHEVRVESVPVVALADALANARELRPDGASLIVKMNIEGAECSAILGTPPSAWAEVDEVFVETHPWADCDDAQLAQHLVLSGLTRVESAHPAVLHMRREGSPRSGPRRAPR
jgi:FkbM family methyltransferase